jgi:NAD(P)-dependent dehydrogenase (short-subunit alcohol dehydrogenase family)
MFDLSGRIALVTGAGQGVGAGIARQLAGQGATVAVNDLEGERAEATATAITATGGRAQAFAFDVADWAAVEAGVKAVETEVGAIDVLVNNAGVPAGMGMIRFRDTQPADWAPYVDINLYGVLHCCKAVVEGMCDRGFGRVITISSGAGTAGTGIGVAAYGAGKGGGIGFMRNLALELASDGVTVNSIALGLMNNVPKEAVPLLANTVPVGRLGDPDEIGACCVYLASNEASWMTAQTLQLNGGSVTT